MAATKNTEKKDFQIWRINKDSKAGIIVTPEQVVIVGNKDNFFAVSQSGTTIAGETIHKQTMGENERQGGLFTHVNDFSQMIPTTLVTPAPQLVPFPPLAIVTTVLKTLPVFLAALG